MPHLSPDATPTEVVSVALESYSAGDWHRLSILADPESIRAWRDEFVLANTHVPTVAELAMERPEAPVWALARLREEDYVARLRRFEANLPRTVAGVRTADELRALDPTELLVRYLEAHDELTQVVMLYTAAYDAAALPLPDISMQRPPLGFRPVHEEKMRDTDARVLLREVGPSGEPDGEEAEWMLRRQPDGSWRVVVTEDFLSLTGVTSIMIDDPVVSKFLQS